MLYDIIAMIGTSDQSCWLAGACTLLLLLLLLLLHVLVYAFSSSSSACISYSEACRASLYIIHAKASPRIAGDNASLVSVHLCIPVRAASCLLALHMLHVEMQPD